LRADRNSCSPFIYSDRDLFSYNCLFNYFYSGPCSATRNAIIIANASFIETTTSTKIIATAADIIA
jgi:hypothetical protein